MILMPDDSTAVPIPFTEEPTLIPVCDIIEPSTMQDYERDRATSPARRGVPEVHRHRRLPSSSAPEPEFFIFDEVKFKSDISGSDVQIFSEQASWNTDAISSPATRAIAWA